MAAATSDTCCSVVERTGSPAPPLSHTIRGHLDLYLVLRVILALVRIILHHKRQCDSGRLRSLVSLINVPGEYQSVYL
jgi:hypothetical protein